METIDYLKRMIELLNDLRLGLFLNNFSFVWKEIDDLFNEFKASKPSLLDSARMFYKLVEFDKSYTEVNLTYRVKMNRLIKKLAVMINEPVADPNL